MSLIKWKKPNLFPMFDTSWDEIFDQDFFKQRFKLGTSVPAVNSKETDKSIELELALPGINKEDLDIKVENNMLIVSSEKEEMTEEKDDEYKTRQEFNYSSFERSFRIPEYVESDNITADYKNGILNLHLPKTEAASENKTKKIEVK